MCKHLYIRFSNLHGESNNYFVSSEWKRQEKETLGAQSQVRVLQPSPSVKSWSLGKEVPLAGSGWTARVSFSGGCLGANSHNQGNWQSLGYIGLVAGKFYFEAHGFHMQLISKKSKILRQIRLPRFHPRTGRGPLIVGSSRLAIFNRWPTHPKRRILWPINMNKVWEAFFLFVRGIVHLWPTNRRASETFEPTNQSSLSEQQFVQKLS